MISDGRRPPLKTAEEAIFEQVFKAYFKSLYIHAYTLVKDRDDAKEIVQQVFFKLWYKKMTLNMSVPIAAYLYKAVHNESLNHIKHLKVKAAYRKNALHISGQFALPNERTGISELENKVTETLLELPEKCRIVFQLSRNEALKYSEIAERLGISVKAVEKHITRALQLFRIKLKDYIPLFIAYWMTR